MGNSVSIKNILECICIRCAKLLIDPPDNLEQINRKVRANYIKKLIGTNKTCRSKHGCGTIQPKIIFNKLNRCEYVYGAGNREKLSSEYVLSLFKKIDNKTVKILGMDPKWARPEWMIFTRLPVPPPALRPSIKSETTKSEDDLVVAYESIIKTNDQLRRSIEQGNQKVIQTYEDLLNLYINSMISGKSTATGEALVAFSTGGKPLKSIKDRISSKDGRVRGNLMGKRVDYSARTVITPEPNISVDELGIPIDIAKILTFPEIVTKDNMDEMYRLVRNGPYVYPGANAIKQENGSTKTLKYVDIQNLVLQEGDIIERHIIDGDIVLFNRQPSLHKMSMMGHRAVILPEKTFRLNPSACNPYNADFDGDEMNMYFPRSLKSALEVKRLALVPTQMVTPAKSSSIIGVIQDTLLGCYKATKYVSDLDAKEFNNIMLSVDSYTGQLKNKKYDSKATYNTRDIFSNILPPATYCEINKSSGEKTFDIEEGIFKKGIIGKSQLKPGGAGKLHFIYNTWHDYGMDDATTLINSIQRTINQWLVHEGHTLGLGDLLVQNEDINQQINLFIAESLDKYQELREKVANKKIIPGIGRSMEDEFEHQTGIIFNNLFNDKLPFLIKKDYLEKIDSNLYNMVNSGSKGSMINVTQIMGCIGPISIGGKRIPKAYGERALPHFEKYDDDAISRGFVANNYITGSDPVEFFFQMASGREGSIDTAIKSVTGDTPIIIIENKKTKKVLIGDWIDAKLKHADKNDIEYHEQHDQELLKVNDIFIPTTDCYGQISWGQVTAITRHDPGPALYKIVTESGREVIVTASKSLLVWSNEENQYVRMNTPKVKVGDCVPTTLYLPEPPIRTNYLGEEPLDVLTNPAHLIQDFLNMHVGDMNHEHIMMYARLGLFTKINKDTITVMPISHDQVRNDTVLDRIISIDKVDVSLYPKVYDLTVPSTLNFCLANGLHVVDTADSGYISRKLVKSMEDLTAHYDGVVRNSVNRVHQFIYGEHGLNPTYCEHTNIELISLNDKEMKERYQLTGKDKLITEEYNRLLYYRKLLREYIYQYNSDIDISFLCPINLTRIIRNAKQQLKTSESKTLLEPTHVIRRVNGLCKLLPKLHKFINIDMKDNIELTDKLDNSLFAHLTEKQLLTEPLDVEELFTIINKEKNHYDLAALLVIIYIKSQLSVKDVLVKHKLTKEMFDYVIDKIVFKYSRAIMIPGTVVGAIAAQSIGEPTTQQTLNTFHLAGVAAKSQVLSGLPRIKELLRVTKNIQTGLQEIFLDEEHITDKYKAK